MSFVTISNGILLEFKNERRQTMKSIFNKTDITSKRFLRITSTFISPIFIFTIRRWTLNCARYEIKRFFDSACLYFIRKHSRPAGTLFKTVLGIAKKHSQLLKHFLNVFSFNGYTSIIVENHQGNNNITIIDRQTCEFQFIALNIIVR